MENKKNQSDRRRFISRCLKVTAGVSLLGSSLKLNANPNSPEEYAYCCIYCNMNDCSLYSNSCNGCKSTKPPQFADTCSVRKCCIEKGLVSCGLCSELSGCNQPLWVNYPATKQNALRLQKIWLGTDIIQVTGRKYFIYPNPASDVINIESPIHKITEFRLINLQGAVLKNGNADNSKTSINVSDLSSGEYLLQLFNGSVLQHIERIIKQ